MKILVVFGTRPEAIKMAPIIKKIQNDSSFEVAVCVTAQHREMLDQVLELFEIKPEFDLNLMKKNQTLTNLSIEVLKGLEGVLECYAPDLVLVHGDTTTSFVASLACFYKKIKVAHIEAGLRTGNIYSPWPEEGNRQLTARLACLHFAPTEEAKKNLLNENVEQSSIFIVGNSVIDALLVVSEKIDNEIDIFNKLNEKFHFLNNEKKKILVTAHRRENFGEGFVEICKAIKEIAQRDDVQIIFPVHLNPSVQEPVKKYLSNIENVFLIEPQDYLPFVFLMKESYLILTDSGGIQEEAPSLGKPVLVMRDSTERPEALAAGTVRLVGSNFETIVKQTIKLLNSSEEYKKMSHILNPYGDGQTAGRVVEVIKNLLG